MTASLIIRTRNEEKWIALCLKAVFAQNYKDFEVILVDNESTDKTVEKARGFDIKVVSIRNFLPGKAINYGIEQSKGEIIVCLSGHCIPVDENWLAALVRNLEDRNVAGVYGRQVPMSCTSDFDKRDLINLFGFDRRVQVKDTFFHNANSAFRRETWKRFPFDATVTNIEDRVWGKTVTENGLTIVYEPEAAVYHHHGLHQENNPERARNVVRILESLSEPISQKEKALIEDMKIAAIIPVKGECDDFGGRPLFEYTVEDAKRSRFIDRVFISTDSPLTAEKARAAGAEVPFLRPAELSRPEASFEKALQYSLENIEQSGYLPDLIVYLGIHVPFRPAFLIDRMIELLFHGGFDNVFPGFPVNKSCWVDSPEGGFHRIERPTGKGDEGSPFYIGYRALACAIYPEFVRRGLMHGKEVGIFKIDDVLSTLDVRDPKSRRLAEQIFPGWRKSRPE